MNDISDEISGKVLAYLKDEMKPEERARFEARMTESEEVRAEVERGRAFLNSLSDASDPAMARRVNDLIREVITLGVSDLHLLPERHHLTVRVRLDGVLKDYATLPKPLSQAMVDRWKVLADMNVAERRLPQDGRLPLKHENRDFDIRVSVVPTLYGERVTARILNRSDVRVGLEQLGYMETQQKTLKRLARLRAGLILVGGWSGTGKTTLMYSMLKEAQSPDLPTRNILTVEEPIELQLPGVSQIGLNRRAGLNYSAGLRAVLRSDPDIVMCGEIRDAETASLCVETALTGHLVISSLPVANALGIVERLRGFDIPDFLIADTVVGLVGLQLVRRVDTFATEEYTPSAEDLSSAGLTLEDGPFRRGVPDDRNGNTGYRGRIPLIEIIEVNDRFRRRLAEGAPAEQLVADAFPRGAGSLRQDAYARVGSGLTTVEEINWALSQYPRF